ncbi:MAG: hypothetical protein ACTSU6_04800 [Candidatus Njordarchaeales archaeon]
MKKCPHCKEYIKSMPGYNAVHNCVEKGELKPLDAAYFRMHGADNYSEAELIDIILLWAQSNERFNPSFVNKISKSLIEKGKITIKQKLSLVNIISKFKIELPKKD